MTQPENQIFAFCHRMGKSRIAPSRLDCGVYVIFNVEKGRVYIGQSGKLLARYNQHFNALMAGVHENTLMQSDWNECGEDAFSFAVYTIASPECLVQLEAELIELCFGEYCYNRPQGGRREGAGRPSLVKGDPDSTFNPWWGCQKVGPGCDHCYAESLDKRTGGEHWGPGAQRRRTSVKNWNDPVRWNAKADAFFAEHGRRQRVFCASMADVFDNAIDPQWRFDLFELIARTPDLDWLLLTKRIGNAKDMIAQAIGPGWMPSNVWLGATIVNQAEAERDIPKLLDVPAAVRFLSMEPLLGPVSFEGMWVNHANPAMHENMLEALDWVIVGGESGPGARPMHPDYARSLRDQCEAAGVPFLFKQWGDWVPMMGHTEGVPVHGPKFTFLDGTIMGNAGKKAAGRFLDGRTWDGYPS